MTKKIHRKSKLSLRKKKPATIQAKISAHPHRLSRQFFRFLIVGIVNTIINYAVYALLLFLGIEYKTANFGALLAGIIFSFKTQRRFVFKHRHQPQTFFSFCLLYDGNLFL